MRTHNGYQDGNRSLTVGEVASFIRELGLDLAAQDFTIYSTHTHEYYRIDAPELVAIGIPDSIITFQQFAEWSRGRENKALAFKVDGQEMAAKQVRVADESQDILDVGHVYIVMMTSCQQ